MRRFRLDRSVDVTGVSGTGCVAMGVLFNDGAVVIRWLGDSPTTTLHASMASVEKVHLHGGHTKIRWEDKVCFACGAEADNNYGPGHCNYCGASWVDHPVDAMDPSRGSWSKAIVIEPKAE